MLACGVLLAACSANAASPVPPTSTPSVRPPTAVPAATPTAVSTVSAPSPSATLTHPAATPSAAPPSGAPSASPGASPSTPASTPSPAGGGSITVGDAGAVDPLSRAVAAAAQAASPGLQVDFQTSEDFSAFCAGSLDAYGAARKIDAKKDAAACVKNGVEFLEFKVAINATAVVATVADQAIGCLAIPDLYAIFGPESTGIADWKDVSNLAATVGSDSQFDPSPLSVTGPAADAPASQLLIAKAIAPLATQRGKDPTLRTDYTTAADDNALIAALSSVPAGAIGWTGLSTALAHTDTVRALRVDAGDGCVDPDAAKADSGAYALSSPLYLYVNAASAAANPALDPFVQAYLSDDTQSSIVAALSYVPINPGDLDDARFAWENR